MDAEIVTSFSGSAQLLERSRQLAALEESLAAVGADGKGRLLLVHGEAGIGKTALLRHFCDERRDSVRVLWGACDALFTPRPLGPLLDIGESVHGDFARLVESSAKPYQVAAALVKELRTGTTVLVLEDVHWADEATLDVLTLLAARIDSAPALGLVTYRDDELDRAPQFRLVLGEVVRRAARLSLDPLSPTAVGELGHDRVDVEELYRRTGGNPFFVTEVLAGGDEQVPETVRDAVLARAGCLSEPARALLEAVAVVPGQVELPLLGAIADGTLDSLDECLAAGILTSAGETIAFRHELARCAIEESIGPQRQVSLHKAVLATLRGADPDPARVAHHAEAAGDRAAVLEFATAAGARAASVGAHREAAAQYARALRFADGLDPRERGELLERLSDEQFVIADDQGAVASVTEALEGYRRIGDRRKQANALCALARRLGCWGDLANVGGPVGEAIELLEGDPPCRELARAYALDAALAMNAEDVDAALERGRRAVEFAERLGEHDILVYALNDLGTIEFLTGVSGGRERLEESLTMALEAGYEDHAGRAFIHLAWVTTRIRDYVRAAEYLRRGIEYCTERDLDTYGHYLFARRAQMELGRGRWDDAAESAEIVIGDRRTAPGARAAALAVLALVRARRGDVDHVSALDQVYLADGDLQRNGPVVAARAEILWLEGRAADIGRATEVTLELALRCRAPWVVGELAYWRRQAGLRDELPDELVAEPYRLALAEDARGAARCWDDIGGPYEAALALADSNDLDDVVRSLEALQAMGARTAAAIVERGLRDQGVRGVRRGPRPATRANPAGLTARELEVLALVAEGLRNAEIAERLVVSEKTVGHHVSAVLRKLEVRSRVDAGREAARLGIELPVPR